MVDLGSRAMALRVNLGRRYGVKRRANPKGGELVGGADTALIRGSKVMEPGGGRIAAQSEPSPRQPLREWRDDLRTSCAS
jgi:hypothetical protein